MDITETIERMAIVDETLGAASDTGKVNEEEENEDPLDIDLPILVHQYQDAMTKIAKKDPTIKNTQEMRQLWCALRSIKMKDANVKPLSYNFDLKRLT